MKRRLQEADGKGRLGELAGLYKKKVKIKYMRLALPHVL